MASRTQVVPLDDDKSLAEDDADEDPPESPYAWAFGVLLDAKATMAPKIVSVTLLYLMMAFQIMLCFIQAAPKEGTLTATLPPPFRSEGDTTPWFERCRDTRPLLC